jgi:glycine/D-amino acid oxidase-like deaminating enzyme
LVWSALSAARESATLACALARKSGRGQRGLAEASSAWEGPSAAQARDLLQALQIAVRFLHRGLELPHAGLGHPERYL